MSRMKLILIAVGLNLILSSPAQAKGPLLAQTAKVANEANFDIAYTITDARLKPLSSGIIRKGQTATLPSDWNVTFTSVEKEETGILIEKFNEGEKLRIVSDPKAQTQLAIVQ